MTRSLQSTKSKTNTQSSSAPQKDPAAREKYATVNEGTSAVYQVEGCGRARISPISTLDSRVDVPNDGMTTNM